jgi:hypothetical protein
MLTVEKGVFLKMLFITCGVGLIKKTGPLNQVLKTNSYPRC